MKAEWITALGHLTYGIYVLTSAHEEVKNGMIASWVSQISYDPLLVSVAVHHHRYSHGLIENSGFFAIHSLAKAQKDFLERFKGSDSEAKFADLNWQRGRSGCPIIKDSLSCLECQVVDRLDPGNHSLFIGKVEEIHQFTDSTPLTTRDYEGIYLGRR